MKRITKVALALLMALSAQEGVSAAQDGYFKDVFMDGGINITSRKDLPSARFLGLSIEAYYSAPHKAPSKITLKDTIEQTLKMVHSDIDDNGCLLYPDGAPRYRVIYSNGGKAGKHGESLTEVGRQHIRDFVAHGGSYVGTCAGAFCSSKGDVNYNKDKKAFSADNYARDRWEYYGIYPAHTLSTSGLLGVTTGMKVEPGSPLLRYFDFGGDMYIDSVYHNGGCFISEDPRTFAPGTEILLRYSLDPKMDADRVAEGRFSLTDSISAWAYKASEKTGRIVDCGSHPEGVTYGERLELFSSFLLYAMDGNGKPTVKGELKNGQKRVMDKETKDNDPAYTRIGDKQYHHFVVNIPEGAKKIKVKVTSPEYNYIDFNLAMNKGDFAFVKTATYKDITLGAEKVLEFDSLPAGKWYIGVECATTVETVPTDYGVAYKGKLEVLNGIPYTITVTWNE